MNTIKEKDKDKNKNSKIQFTITILCVGLAITLCFVVVICKLYNIMFINGEKYSSMAYSQYMKSEILDPDRGIIYDANGEVLAKSVSVKTISVNPGSVKYYNRTSVDNTFLAKGLAECLDLNFDEVVAKISSNSSVVVVAKKVDDEKAEKLTQWLKDNSITKGVNIDEDTKRYYPFGNLASNLIGFCGDDNTGTVGIEERWNDELQGNSGKIVAIRDLHKESISDETEQYIPVENGSNIYLTIDTEIQQISEKYLKQAVEENKCTDGGSVIVMNPQNGDILAMASYPDFNLNQPFAIEATGDSDKWDELTTEEKNNSYTKLWSNKSVSKLYEPGSTFKIITSAVALEENIITTDNGGDFLCTGVQQVEDYSIHCWRAEPHGYQSLRMALCNSCNPAFIQLGQKIGVETLFDYYEALGLFDTIGSDIAKTYKAQFHEESKMGKVELATYSFGQRFEISPLQLITAVSAIINDGKYVEPRIVSKIENTNTGITEVKETKEVRQIVSKETSEKIRDMMKSVVTDGTGKRAAVEGYSIGGKSGTSEPTSANVDQGYVASFIAAAPIDEPEVVVLVILNDPEGETYQGGQTAGPVVKNILSEVLPYLKISTNAEKVITE